MSGRDATIGAVWQDGRVARGMETQLARRRSLVDGGARMAGWKVGLTSQALLEAAGICAPVVGFIPSASLRVGGTSVSISGWTKPMLEPEIALRLGFGLKPGSTREQAAMAVNGIAPALELIDIDRPFAELEDIIAEGVFLRHVLLGPWRAADSVNVAELRGQVYVDGVETNAIEDPATAVGDLAEILLHIVECLAAAGVEASEGDVVITGSIVPAIPLVPGRIHRFDLDPIGSVEVELTI